MENLIIVARKERTPHESKEGDLNCRNRGENVREEHVLKAHSIIAGNEKETMA